MKNLLIMLLAITTTIGFSTELDYEQFKESCQNPAQYGHQNAPTKIKLLCQNFKTEWQQVESTQTQLQETRSFNYGLISNKHTVNTQTANVSVPEKVISCPRYNEVTKEASIEVSMTCEQILAVEQTLQEMCQVKLNEAIANNPNLESSTDTGRAYTMCDE